MKLTLSQKIFAITQKCSTIERKGVGESSDPNKPLYSYVKIEDVLDVVNPLLKRYKLILQGSVPKEPITHVSKFGAVTETLVEWTLTDVDSGETKVYRVPGAGSDEAGKGIYRSLTGSRKYAMVLIFNLKFGDEPEEVQRATDVPEARAKKEERNANGES